MTFFDAQDLYFVIPALLIAIGLLVAFLFLRQRRQARGLGPEVAGIVFLAENGQIIDETPLARLTLGPQDAESMQWEDFHKAFAFRFPRLPSTFAECQSFAPVELRSSYANDMARLELKPYGPRLKITLSQHDNDRSGVAHHLAFREHHQNLAVTGCAHDAPFPVWVQDNDGREIWRNAEYLTLRETYLASNDETPLFELQFDRLRSEGPMRYRLPDQSELGECWYEVSMTESATHRSFYAADVTKLVRAEQAQRGFVQTLTKTFAQLGTGLAIFDRKQQLVLFNPALIELTHISAEFLTAKPSLTSFFDWLRDSRMMPEPRDYSEWREKLSTLPNAAAEGTFSELWSLPNGLSYRVLGRPHPDGAIAFLFEDVTDQLSLTRNFVKELEINHTLLDGLPQALAVFTSRGEILSVNRAYQALWDNDPATQVSPVSVTDTVRSWSARTKSHDALARIETALLQSKPQSDVSGTLKTSDQSRYQYRVFSLALGAKAVAFEPINPPEKPTEPQRLSTCPAPLDA